MELHRCLISAGGQADGEPAPKPAEETRAATRKAAEKARDTFPWRRINDGNGERQAGESRRVARKKHE